METTTGTVDELRAVGLFAGLSGEQLGWLAERAGEVRLGAGDYVVRQGDANGVFFVQLDGQTEWTKNVDGQEVYALTHGPGTFYGHEPILLDIPIPVSGRALTAVRLLAWDEDAFWGLIGLCPGIVRGLLTTIAQRVQAVETVAQQEVRLAALGKLAAGLAHELNNPAAAASRAIGELRGVAGGLGDLALELARLGLDPAATEGLGRARAAALAAAATASGAAGSTTDPLALSDREDELALWLEGRGVDEAWELAPTFAAAGLDAGWLEELAGAVPAALGPGLRYLAASLAAAGLLAEAEAGTARVSRLVGAVREYAYLDQGPEQEVDVRDGLENTLTVLGHLIGGRGIAVARDYDPALPRLFAAGGELNQVWTALLENAIDAAGEGGWIAVRTAAEAGRILVEIADDGPGIPEAIRDRIWEPFFTTKPVGEGTGLGLDTVRRVVVERHGGDVRLESRPGETRFLVRLPLAAPAVADGGGRG